LTVLRVLLAATGHGQTRAAGHTASRRALRLLTGILGDQAGSTSLSHTGEMSVAAAAVGATAGIGVDLEENRPVDPEARRFFLREHERGWLAAADSPAEEHIRLWTVKEALFKADPDNSGTVLGSYTVADPGARAGTAVREPSVRFWYQSTRLGPRHLSVAVCLNRVPAWRPAPGAVAEAVLNRIADVLAIPRANLLPDTPLRCLIRENLMLAEFAAAPHAVSDSPRPVETLGDLVEALRHRPPVHGLLADLLCHAGRGRDYQKNSP
jgi:hypothetical protein